MADMTCARRAGYPMCETCTAAGLVRCPSLGAPLPLVEGEKYEKNIVYPPGDWSQRLDGWKPR